MRRGGHWSDEDTYSTFVVTRRHPLAEPNAFRHAIRVTTLALRRSRINLRPLIEESAHEAIDDTITRCIGVETQGEQW